MWLRLSVAIVQYQKQWRQDRRLYRTILTSVLYGHESGLFLWGKDLKCMNTEFSKQRGKVGLRRVKVVANWEERGTSCYVVLFWKGFVITCCPCNIIKIEKVRTSYIILVAQTSCKAVTWSSREPSGNIKMHSQRSERRKLPEVVQDRFKWRCLLLSVFWRCKCLFYNASIDRETSELWILNYFEGSGCDLIEVLSQHLPEGSEENYKHLLWRWPMSCPSFEPSTCQIEV